MIRNPVPSSAFNKVILAAGILAVAGVVLKNTLVPFKTGDDDPPATGPAHHPASSDGSRRDRPPVRPAFAGEATPESQAWLVSLGKLASRDPQQALAQLAGILDPALRSLALTSIAAGWAQVDAPAAAKWVADLQPEDDAARAALGLVPVWATRAPADCLDWANQRPPGTLREMSLVELADAWGSAHPQEALTRFLTLESDEGSERGLQTIVTQWALDAPQAAVDSLSRMDPASRRDELLQAALVSLSNQDPDLTWKYSDRFSDPGTVEHVRSMALEAIAETRPQDAIKLAATRGNSETLLAGIARGWASADDAGAKTWIHSLADPDLAAKLLQEISGEP